jgi:hypothetical protein
VPTVLATSRNVTVHSRRVVKLAASGFIALAAIVAPARGQTVTSAGEPAGDAANSAAAVPDFSHVWSHPAFPWFEPAASGPRPVTNRSRWPQRPGDDSGTIALPPLPPGAEGVSDYDQLVGDYTNPILQPWAAEVVKKFGQMSLAGITYGNPSNQCWPMPMLFIYKEFMVEIIQQPDRVLLIHTAPNTDIRRVRLNDRHPELLTPSWYGDSIGHYEGDTLVIDTVGVRTDRPYAMIDLFGTPYTKSLHIVERYSLREFDEVKDALERSKKENWFFNGDVFSSHRGKFLQVHLTVEDEGTFTTPWTATLTYVPGPEVLPEGVCAENPHQYYYDRSDTDIPRAEKPDF